MSAIAEVDETVLPPAPPATLSAAAQRPWVEKYRPLTLENVVAHEHILETLRRLMSSKGMPHLLFYGPPGTGKTTTVQACARELFGSGNLKSSVLELNASDDRGIDVVRNEIKDFASTSSFGGGFFGAAGVQASKNAGEAAARPAVGYKLVVLDEADQMSHEAQAALRRVIEKYTKNVRFCILCNHVNKIIPAVQSRCTRFRFSPVQKSAMLPRLAEIARSEGVPADNTGLAAAFKLSNGDMRRCLNLMQACALARGLINEDAIYEVAGNPKPAEVADLGTMILSTDFSTAYAKALEMVTTKGTSVTDIVTELHPIIHKMNFPQECKWFAMVKLADVEHNLAIGCSESMALAAVVGMLQIIKESVTTGRPALLLARC